MEIENTEVYGLYESVCAAGYPKGNDTFKLDLAMRLGNAKQGSGHDCFLKGIIVQADVIAPQYWWLQFGRYHFHDIVSSESKMHTLTKMDIAEQCNEYVWPETIVLLNRAIHEYKQNPDKQKFQELVSNVPMGLELKARITTNYLQLKSIHNQRKNHKLEEWRVFCQWMEGLAWFGELVLGVKR